MKELTVAVEPIQEMQWLQKAKVTINGVADIAVYGQFDGGRVKCATDDYIVKIDAYSLFSTVEWQMEAAHQGYNEFVLWERLDESDRQYFVPTLMYGCSVDDRFGFVVQPYETFQRDVNLDWYRFAVDLFEKYEIDDFDICQYGVSSEGQLRIFDYGWYSANESGRRIAA